MTEEERQEMLAESRIFSLAAPVIIPLIEKKRKVAMDRLLAKHREGSTEYLTLVSELSVLNDLERDIRSKSETYKLMEDKHARARRV